MTSVTNATRTTIFYEFAEYCSCKLLDVTDQFFLLCISQYSPSLPFFLLRCAFQSVMSKGAPHNYAVKKSTFLF